MALLIGRKTVDTYVINKRFSDGYSKDPILIGCCFNDSP